MDEVIATKYVLVYVNGTVGETLFETFDEANDQKDSNCHVEKVDLVKADN